MSGLQAAVEAAALQDQLKLIYEDMPRDLQQTMLSSPHRAVLLQGPGPQIKVRLPDCATLISEASCIPCLLLQTQVESASRTVLTKAALITFNSTIWTCCQHAGVDIV